MPEGWEWAPALLPVLLLPGADIATYVSIFIYGVRIYMCVCVDTVYVYIYIVCICVYICIYTCVCMNIYSVCVLIYSRHIYGIYVVCMACVYLI